MENKKIALITGSNRGLGFETAKQLGEKGITVIVTGRDQKTAVEAAAKLIALGIDATGIKLDVTHSEDRAAAFAFIKERFGKLDILINNAGVGPKGDFFVNKAVETTEDEFQYVFNTNVFSLVYLTNDLLPLLKASGSARVVNLSSLLGSLGTHSLANGPFETLKRLSYNASKTTLNAVTIHLAAELKEFGIKVNSADPGHAKTAMGGPNAPMEIAEGARTSVDLALIGEDGPTGKFIHLGEEKPW
ncbi:MAG: family NAD(P)-dependent oxidoreductase [Mucilaginibacter sp.]|nr:family NAD(P)-dependent oxidoreductase [Mucilaginibacter sp.]